MYDHPKYSYDEGMSYIFFYFWQRVSMSLCVYRHHMQGKNGVGESSEEVRNFLFFSSSTQLLMWRDWRRRIVCGWQDSCLISWWHMATWHDIIWNLAALLCGCDTTHVKKRPHQQTVWQLSNMCIPTLNLTTNGYVSFDFLFFLPYFLTYIYVTTYRHWLLLFFYLLFLSWA